MFAEIKNPNMRNRMDAIVDEAEKRGFAIGSAEGKASALRLLLENIHRERSRCVDENIEKLDDPQKQDEPLCLLSAPNAVEKIEKRLAEFLKEQTKTSSDTRSQEDREPKRATRTRPRSSSRAFIDRARDVDRPILTLL